MNDNGEFSDLPMHSIRKKATTAFWSGTPGHIKIVNNVTGEVREIPYRDADEESKNDIKNWQIAKKKLRERRERELGWL